jgi:hypothetical protein
VGLRTGRDVSEEETYLLFLHEFEPRMVHPAAWLLANYARSQYYVTISPILQTIQQKLTWRRNAEAHSGGMDLSLVSVALLQAEASAAGRSLVQGSPTECDQVEQ